jgi:hypothetical protein
LALYWRDRRTPDFNIILGLLVPKLRSKVLESFAASWESSVSGVRITIVMIVETKRDGQGGSQADLQLSVWVNGHFDPLADLRKTALNPSDRTIWLPLLKGES